MKLIYSRTGEMGMAARDAAKIESGYAGMPQGLQQLEQSESGAAMAATRGVRAPGVARRLWTREDGFTMSGCRRT